MWAASQRSLRHRGQKTVIFHLGDHDPSGLDMSRDIQDRLKIFGVDVEFHRIALNKEQVDEYSPPPNPAKIEDSRFADYEALYGNQSWELDALSPVVLTALIREEIEAIRDDEKWAARETEEEEGKEKLVLVAKRWDAIEKLLAKGPKGGSK
jgi:hypothetical protein